MTEKQMVTLSVDPGTTSGWAVFVDGEHLAHGKVKDVSPRRAYQVVRYYQRHYPQAQGTLLVEDQYLFTPKVSENDSAKDAVEQTSQRFRSIAKVIRIRGWWEAAGALCGFDVQPPVLAQRWQGPTGVVRLARLQFQGNRKKAARFLAAQIFGGTFTADEADATLLGRWFETERRTRVKPDAQLALPGVPTQPRRRSRRRRR